MVVCRSQISSCVRHNPAELKKVLMVRLTPTAKAISKLPLVAIPFCSLLLFVEHCQDYRQTCSRTFLRGLSPSIFGQSLLLVLLSSPKKAKEQKLQRLSRLSDENSVLRLGFALYELNHLGHILRCFCNLHFVVI